MSRPWRETVNLSPENVPLEGALLRTLRGMVGVPLLDELMANAWRPIVTEVLGGWRYRWADGVTRRANSALALGGEDLDALVLRAEQFYRERDLCTMIQVSTASAPKGFAELLAERGYRHQARTMVLQAAISDVAARTSSQSYEVVTSSTATDGWFEAYWSVEATRGRPASARTVCRDVLLRPGPSAAFVAVCDGGRVVGTGQLVVERGWGGVQCMTTVASHRRRGVAQSVLHALAREAVRRDVERMYLAVVADSEAARALYASAGFEVVHEYSYFVE